MGQLTDKSVLCTHAAVRLIPPKPGDGWTVSHLTRRKTFRVSAIGAMVLIGFMGGATVDDVISMINRHCQVDIDGLRRLIRKLNELGLIVDDGEPSHQWALKVLKDWNKYGWSAAADHHLVTFDYPFEPYDAEGQKNDALRMAQYLAAEPDVNRGKRFEAVLERIPAPTAREALEALTEPFSVFWEKPAETGVLNVRNLQLLLSSAFGILRRRKVSQPGRPPLVRKTSPSGGARHPTEGYVVVTNIPGLSEGIYHFCSLDNTLDKVSELPLGFDPSKCFPGLLRASFVPGAFIILTSVFERNMYRYREPRTFRTVFMDAGHIAATIEIVAKALGLQTWIQHGINDDYFESLIGADRFEEGVIYGIALGGGRCENDGTRGSEHSYVADVN